MSDTTSTTLCYIFIITMTVSISALIIYSFHNDKKMSKARCQVCTGTGAVTLTDIDPERWLCQNHRNTANNIATLEYLIFGEQSYERHNWRMPLTYRTLQGWPDADCRTPAVH